MKTTVGFLAAAFAWCQGTEYPAIKFRSNYLASYYASHASNTTPWYPAWSPDGRYIAVSMHGSIWIITPSSGAAVEVTHSRKLHSSPAWSPDGKWIVYTADDDWKSIQLEAVDPHRGEVRVLTNDSQVYLDPTFSPDGTRLAYVSTGGAGNLNVFVRGIRDGAWTAEPIQVTRDNSFGRARLYFSDWDIHIQPAWLSDGKELLMLSNRGIALGSGDLWRVPAEPDAMTRARRILSEQTLYRTRPDVSPDGKRIVYSSTGGASDQFNHLYVLPVGGGHPYKLTFGDFDDFHPRWSPDGESIAFVSNDGGLPQLYVLDVNGGARRRVGPGRRTWKTAPATVWVTVVDEATGKPTEARISGSASDGRLYGPSDTFVFNARLASGLKRVFYTSGNYSIQVPPGKVIVEASKGFEFEPSRAEMEVESGTTHQMRLTLRRKVDAAAKGWYNGSTHVHMNYGGHLRNTPEHLMLMARAQGMHIVSALVANKDNRILDWQYFKKDAAANRQVLVFGEENRPPFWGHTFYIGLREHLISPFLTGYDGTALDSLYPSNTDLFLKARAQGAATGYVHAFGGDGDPLAGGLGGAKAFPVDVALGTIDALEWSSASRGSLIPLFHAWNNDFPVAPVGGEDALANMQDHRPVGIIRTYAWMRELTVAAWVEAIKKGHTYMSSGPVVDFRVGGQVPGDSVKLPADGGEVAIEVDVASVTPVRKATIYRDGKPWKECGEKFSGKVRVDASTWFSLVVESEDGAAYGQAVTNCVRVYVGSGKIRNAASAKYFIDWIGKLKSMTSSPSQWRTERERVRVHEQLDRAIRVFETR